MTQNVVRISCLRVWELEVDKEVLVRPIVVFPLTWRAECRLATGGCRQCGSTRCVCVFVFGLEVEPRAFFLRWRLLRFSLLMGAGGVGVPALVVPVLYVRCGPGQTICVCLALDPGYGS